MFEKEELELIEFLCNTCLGSWNTVAPHLFEDAIKQTEELLEKVIKM